MAVELSIRERFLAETNTADASSSSERIFDITSLDTAPPPPYTSGVAPQEELPRWIDLPATTTFEPGDRWEEDRARLSWFEQDTWAPDPPEEPLKRRDDKVLERPNANAMITYSDIDESLGKIENLHLDIIEQKSPLIAAAFEQHGRQYRLHLDVLTSLSARPFVRYLYVDSYAEVDERYEQVPSSLLLHCQMHTLGGLFDIAELQSQASVNVLRQCEFACFSAERPIDLVAAIRYCYDHVEYNRRPIDNIMAYCIERFNAHRLGEYAAFRDLAYHHRPFHYDIVRVLVERGYQDEAAQDIISLPFAPPEINGGQTSQRCTRQQPETSKRPHSEDKQPVQPSPKSQDVVSETLFDQDHWTERVAALHVQSLLTMALRGKQQVTADTSSERPHKRVKSTDDDFVLVDTADSETDVDQEAGILSDDEPFVVLPIRAANKETASATFDHSFSADNNVKSERALEKGPQHTPEVNDRFLLDSDYDRCESGPECDTGNADPKSIGHATRESPSSDDEFERIDLESTQHS